MATSASDLQQLRVILLKAASGLPELVEKRMFGCAALFTKGNIFALVWKHGRLGVRLPDQAQYDELMAKEGAEPWQPGPQMAHWVLVPSELHGNMDELSGWVKRAHALAQARRDAQQKPAESGDRDTAASATDVQRPAAGAPQKPAQASAPKPKAAQKSSSTVPPASKKKPSASKAAATKPTAKKSAGRGR
jgi:TfoX/Sxy family transcriptional regulator of competence genes